jgi:hypothetical protein
MMCMMLFFFDGVTVAVDVDAAVAVTRVLTAVRADTSS